MQLKDGKNFKIGLNMDDVPSDLQPGEYSDMLNARTLSSSNQHESGNAETLQSEISVLINPDSLITYYGGAIGGQFVYSGYEEVTIGAQTWMKKNYDVNYPGSKVYNDDEDNRTVYGGLYTHNQIMSADFCPEGWRVPTEADIDILIAELLGSAVAGGKMKNVGTELWIDPNTGAVDSVEFKAVPGGKFDLLFELLGESCLLWLQDDGVPYAPVALNGSEITSGTFIANWKATEGATGYYLDVATDVNFTAFVAGFNNKDVGNVLLDAVGGLVPSTQYYFMVRAYNEIGSSENSNIITLTTIDGVIDVDGNVYTYVTIGTQQWLVENLKTTKYADGTPIPNLPVNADWIAEDGTPGHDGAYCWYDNDIAYKTPYGALYNWYAVDNVHGLAPAGWRVPSVSDYLTLANYIGGVLAAGGKLKSTRRIPLSHPRWNAQYDSIVHTDDYGFYGQGTGARVTYDSGATFFFDGIGEFSQLWLTDVAPGLIYYGILSNSTNATDANSIHEDNKKEGFSVRLMRDVP